MRIIKSNKASLIVGGGLRLVPGINQVADEVWENAKTTFAIKQMLKDKVLIDQTPKELKQAVVEPVETDETEDRPRQPSALKAIGQNKAIELVRETLDLVLLEDWAEQEDRVKVQSALKAQMKKIREETKPPKKTDEEVDDEELLEEES